MHWHRSVARMNYLQGVEGEIVCFTGVADGHITPDEHDYGLKPVGRFILLGRTSPTLPCTDNGCDIFEAVGFRTSRESTAKSVTALQPASLASQSHKNDDEEVYGRIMIEGCTNPGSLLSQRVPWFKGCKVAPVDNDDSRSIDTLSKSREILFGRNSALWFSSFCIGGTSWIHVNMHGGSSTVTKIKGHWVEFRKLWERLAEIACLAIPQGVAICTEWPRGFRYWTNSNFARFLEKYGFKFAGFDGCMYGFVASHGKDAGLPIKKPWRVAYLNSSF